MPRLRIKFEDCVEKLRIEGLNFDVPERAFMERICQCRERRLDYGHTGIAGIMFICFDQEDVKEGGKGKKGK